jgi:glycosyltransferase involved in cell wall biosynthesis
MKIQPLVSVIIPCYNAGKFLEEAVKSVLLSDYRNFEIIIIDDGSTDSETQAILAHFKSDPQIKIQRQENHGPSIARNNGVKISNADWMIFLDSDDKIYPKTLTIFSDMLDSLEANSHIYYGNYNITGTKNEFHKQGDFNIVKMLRANEIALCSMVNKKAFLEVGGFDEYLSKKGLEDWDLWLSLYEKAFNFRHIDATLFEIRLQDNSRTFEVANKQLDFLLAYIYKKHSEILSKIFLELYHENKNIKNTIEYKIGKASVAIPKMIKQLFIKKANR